MVSSRGYCTVYVVLFLLTALTLLVIHYTNLHAGVDVDLGEVLDPHTVCGLLKLHFRELRVSMIPRGPPLIELIRNVKERNVSHVQCRP